MKESKVVGGYRWMGVCFRVRKDKVSTLPKTVRAVSKIDDGTIKSFIVSFISNLDDAINDFIVIRDLQYDAITIKTKIRRYRIVGSPSSGIFN